MAGGDRLSDSAAQRRDLPATIGRPGPSAYHRLNPLTKATLATVTAIAAVVLGGLIGPALLVVAAVILPAISAGVLRRLVRTSLLLSLPIAVSAFLVNLFFYPGGEEVLFQDRTDHGHRRGVSIRARDPGPDHGDQRCGHTLLPDHASGGPGGRSRAPRGEPARGVRGECIGADGPGHGRAGVANHGRPTGARARHGGQILAPRARHPADRRAR